MTLNGPEATEHAAVAAKAISGGTFDIAEIYNSKGHKLAESMTEEGAAVETALLPHAQPNYTTALRKS